MMISEFIIHFVIVFIVAFVVTFLVCKLRSARKRGGYNLEYPADFISTADQDQQDRFDQEGIDKHYK